MLKQISLSLALATVCSSSACNDVHSSPEFADRLQIASVRASAIALNESCRISDALQRGAIGLTHGDVQAGDISAQPVSFDVRQLPSLVSNGRACSDCHMNSDHFQLSPANAKARHDALVGCRVDQPDWDDPLFRAMDADDFNLSGESAGDFTNLTENGLLRVVFTLPENVRLIDLDTGEPSAETSIDVWRAVPTINNVALTGPDGENEWPRGPNPAGGYQHDARFATLQEQARAALLGHAKAASEPSAALLDDLSAYELTRFSSDAARALAAGTEPPTPQLDALAQQGQPIFERACGNCHGGRSQTVPVPPAFHYHDIVSGCPRPVDAVAPARWVFKPCSPSLTRNERTYEITLPSGEKLRRASSDPGRALLTGVVESGPPDDDWNTFDTPTLLGIGQTAPYFHNNSAATLEEVLDHYNAFFEFVQALFPDRPLPIVSTDGAHFDRKFSLEERPALLAYLRSL